MLHSRLNIVYSYDSFVPNVLLLKCLIFSLFFVTFILNLLIGEQEYILAMMKILLEYLSLVSFNINLAVSEATVEGIG